MPNIEHSATHAVLRQILFASSPRVSRTHLHAYACRIYAASFRAGTGLRRYWPSYPDASPHPLPVRQASALPTASSRSPVTRGTLAVRLTLPLAGCVEDFHLQMSAPCRAHQTKTPAGPGLCDRRAMA